MTSIPKSTIPISARVSPDYHAMIKSEMKELNLDCVSHWVLLRLEMTDRAIEKNQLLESENKELKESIDYLESIQHDRSKLDLNKDSAIETLNLTLDVLNKESLVTKNRIMERDNELREMKLKLIESEKSRGEVEKKVYTESKKKEISSKKKEVKSKVEVELNLNKEKKKEISIDEELHLLMSEKFGKFMDERGVMNHLYFTKEGRDFKEQKRKEINEREKLLNK